MTLNLNNAIWLAKRQMRVDMASYFYSALYFALMGLVLSTDESLAVEYAIPILMFILIQPVFTPRYMTFKTPNDVTRSQEFLHALPIRFSTIVTARAIAMLVAGVINAPMLFVPFWFLGSAFQSLSSHLAWTAFWIGMALVGSGLALVMEFRLSFKSWLWANFVAVIVVIIALFMVIWLVDFRPHTWSVEMAHSHPLLLAIGGLIFGIAGFGLGIAAATDGFRRREFAT